MALKRRIITVFCVGALSGAAIVSLIASGRLDPNGANVEVSKDGKIQYKWHTPETPTSLDFCGEEVPLDRWEIKERLERELISNFYQHGAQLYILKLSGRYFPIIEQRLKENGLPDDLKYLCVAESALNQNAVSGVGAASFWQFMKETGPRYGLEVTDEVDERFNIAKATDAACKYMKECHDKFGSWTAAAAAYNCGPAGFANQASFQGPNNYYDLIFPDETNRYVFRILALKYLISNAQKLGNIVPKGEEYKPLKGKEVVVESTIPDLAVWAKENNTSYKMLKIYNPWLRAHKLTVKPGKKYTVILPE